MLRGSITPLVTPLSGGEVEHERYRALVERQVEAGGHGIVVAGTTGEPGTLTLEERKTLLETALSAAGGRIPVVAATGTNELPGTLELTRHATAAGADAVLVVTPYYLKPSQHGLVAYFEAVAGSTDLPLILYDIPGRAGVGLDVETIGALAQVANIVGVKEARPDMDHISKVMARCGPDFAVYCGVETLCFPMLAVGGAGHMAATGNIVPDDMAAMADAAFAGDWDRARRLHFELLELNDVVFADTNPVPIKIMLAELGLIDFEVRSPLAPPLDAVRERVLDVLRRHQRRSIAATN